MKWRIWATPSLLLPPFGCGKEGAERRIFWLSSHSTFQHSPIVWYLGRPKKTARLQMQAAEMSLLYRFAGLRLRDRDRSLHIRRELWVKLLLLSIKISQLTWFRYLISMFPGCLSVEVFRAHKIERRPEEGPELTGDIIYSFWPVNVLRSP